MSTWYTCSRFQYVRKWHRLIIQAKPQTILAVTDSLGGHIIKALGVNLSFDNGWSFSLGFQLLPSFLA